MAGLLRACHLALLGKGRCGWGCRIDSPVRLAPRGCGVGAFPDASATEPRPGGVVASRAGSDGTMGCYVGTLSALPLRPWGSVLPHWQLSKGQAKPRIDALRPPADPMPRDPYLRVPVPAWPGVC